MVRAKLGEERVFNVSLRKEVEKVPGYKRSSKAIKALRAYVAKHMKCDNVRIGKHLNLKMWSCGKKNPPLKISIKCVKEEIEKKDKKKVEIVKAEIVGAPEEKKVEKKKKLIDKLKEKVPAANTSSK